MVGVIGYISNSKNNLNSLLFRMIRSVQYKGEEQIDMWNDNFLSIARVSHGTSNAEPQPIFNEDNSIFVIMEGNIYDYDKQKLDLINNGHKFKFTKNDPEYCLHLYEETGESSFEKLNGNFIIAIYDLVTREFLLVNDRFSSYNIFYYINKKGTLFFGTKLSTILCSNEIPRILEINSIFEFFTFQRVLGTKTYYKNINVLRPAHILKYKNGNVTIYPYWEMQYKKTGHSKKYYINKLTKSLKKSTQRKTRGDNRFGILLSGGLDSRVVLSASNKKMIAFGLGDFENQEIKIAKKIAEIKGCEYLFLKRNFDHYFNMVDEAVESGDGMYNFFHAHVIGCFKDIKKTSNALFTGVRFEHYFRGTTLPRRTLNIFGKKMNLPFLDKISKKNIIYKILRKLRYSIYDQNPQQLFNEYYAAKYDECIITSIKKVLKNTNYKVMNIYDKFTCFDIYYTSRYPTYVFNLSIRQALDEYIVMFDNDLLDLYLEIPLEYRSNKNLWVAALAKLNPDIARISNSNTGYSPFLSTMVEWLLNFSKKIAKNLHLSKVHRTLPHPTYRAYHGWPNMSKLIKYNKNLQKLIWNTINDPMSINPSIFNLKRIREIFKEHITQKKDHMFFLFLLLTFGKWYKKYGPDNGYYELN